MGENVTGGLQHMGALRPDLPIEAMVKMKHNERARVAPLYLTLTPPFRTQKYMNGRRAAACGGLCGGLRPAAACGNRSPRRRSLPLATLPPATLKFATLPACSAAG